MCSAIDPEQAMDSIEIWCQGQLGGHMRLSFDNPRPADKPYRLSLWVINDRRFEARSDTRIDALAQAATWCRSAEATKAGCDVGN